MTETAMRLFAEQGYDKTTTAQVAHQAGVSEMTLFRHFASKESLLIQDPFDPVMAEAVRVRPADEKPMRAVAEGVRDAWTTVDMSEMTDLRWLLSVVSDTPSLRGAFERNSKQTTAALTRALEERGIATTEARIAAASMIAGLSRALLDWSQDAGSDLDAYVNRALDVLGGQ